MKSLSHQFLDFCRSKPADEPYNYGTIVESAECGCAVTQFTMGHLGFPNISDAGFEPWRKLHEGKVVRALLDGPRTFGALADRLEKALAEQVSA